MCITSKEEGTDYVLVAQQTADSVHDVSIEELGVRSSSNEWTYSVHHLKASWTGYASLASPSPFDVVRKPCHHWASQTALQLHIAARVQFVQP